MANALFDQGKESLYSGGVNFVSDTIKLHLYDAADGAINLSTQDFENDIADAGIVDTATLASVTVSSAGVIDAADTEFTGATTGEDPCEHLIGWKDTGVDTTSPLLFNFDSATGLPVTPNSESIFVRWHATGIIIP